MLGLLLLISSSFCRGAKDEEVIFVYLGEERRKGVLFSYITEKDIYPPCKVGVSRTCSEFTFIDLMFPETESS